VSHFHIDHWGELPALIFAMRWGIEPSRKAPLILIGPVGLETRLRLLAGALGEWVLKPGFPVEVTEIEPNTSWPLSDDATIEAHKTPHTEQSLAYAVEDREVRLVYTADTGPDESLAEWALGCDLLLAECSLPDDRPIDTHLTPNRAGELACKAQARELVLTHFYPVFGKIDPAQIAKRAFDGPVRAASDGDRFEITRGPA
jgi:ribonuclease BN (tRNA processing enzyme)